MASIFYYSIVLPFDPDARLLKMAGRVKRFADAREYRVARSSAASRR